MFYMILYKNFEIRSEISECPTNPVGWIVLNVFTQTVKVATTTMSTH